MGVSIVMGEPKNAGCFMMENPIVRNGWWLGVPRHDETETPSMGLSQKWWILSCMSLVLHRSEENPFVFRWAELRFAAGNSVYNWRVAVQVLGVMYRNWQMKMGKQWWFVHICPWSMIFIQFHPWFTHQIIIICSISCDICMVDLRKHHQLCCRAVEGLLSEGLRILTWMDEHRNLPEK